MRVPLTAKEQLEAARQSGHELSVMRRDNPDFPDALPKFWLSCTCGYRSTARRTEKQVNGLMVWHLGKILAVAETRGADMRRNGL